MNKDQKIKFRNRHLQYQYDLLHQLPSIIKTTNSLSGLYLKKFYNSTKKYQLNLPSSLTDSMGKFCPRCGVVRVPSINTSMKIKPNQNNNPHSFSSSSSFIYCCLLCTNETAYDVIDTQLPSLRSTQTLTNNNNNNNDNKSMADIQNNKKVNKSENKAKIRAKKRKMNTLSNLLSQREKENKNKQKSNGLLSLESFMKI
ncbi:hypothetical protein RI543_004123 [Arxiozyma heterogenica]|uniref:Uncharacterized protein n=1 Tax=Arxiozyma heterogenica TaxID=278026 RepID=A0AAN7WL18_9SACH|nr:hypothetical protein RI543_004123 [Kazachstania heterogenica]